MNALFSLKTFNVFGNVVVHEFDLCPNENDQRSKDDYIGKIGVARRGVCTFDKKANIAESLGMIGMIVINHNESVIPMGCSSNIEAKIPVVMIANNSNTNALYETLKREAFTVRLVKEKLKPRAESPINDKLNSFASLKKEISILNQSFIDQLVGNCRIIGTIVVVTLLMTYYVVLNVLYSKSSREISLFGRQQLYFTVKNTFANRLWCRFFAITTTLPKGYLNPYP